MNESLMVERVSKNSKESWMPGAWGPWEETDEELRTKEDHQVVKDIIK